MVYLKISPRQTLIPDMVMLKLCLNILGNKTSDTKKGDSVSIFKNLRTTVVLFLTKVVIKTSVLLLSVPI